MVAVVQSRPDPGHRAPARTVSSRVRPVATPAVPVSARTYRRRRATAAGIVVTLLAAGQGVLAMAGGDAAWESRPALVAGEPFSTYVVEPGDTFWSIAHRVDPDGDPRPMVDRLVAEHGGAVLQVGDRIAVPERR
ncbi:MAG: LysM peptidoglycan-binding domain-containing protein [Actinomycetota bacterium]|nr:LysM peptidoglycan-binding domain-containing protein [Actinomycetota bacterium]